MLAAVMESQAHQAVKLLVLLNDSRETNKKQKFIQILFLDIPDNSYPINFING